MATHETTPLVTVWCPAFNQEKYIAQALDSFLLQQVNFPIEIVVHDDASTDRTATIIRDYTARRPDIFRPVFQETNQFSADPSALAQTLWRVARGKYVALCEGDDYWTDPLKLQKQVDFLENNPRFTMAFHDYVIVSQDGAAIKSISPQEQRSRTDYEIVRGAPLQTNTVTFVKDIHEIPPELSRTGNNDTILFAYLAAHRGRGAAYQADIKPSVYRRNAGGIWSNFDVVTRKKTAIATYFSIKKFVAKKYARTINYKILSVKFSLFKVYLRDKQCTTAFVCLLDCVGFSLTRVVFRKPSTY